MKYLLFLFALVFLIVPAYAVETLPPVKYGECAVITQLEYNSSYQNITAVYVQGKNKTIFDPQLSMMKSGYSYNYTYCNTNALGTYIVEGCSNLGCWPISFEVTPNGQEATVLQGIVYAIVLFVLILIFGLFMYGAFNIPSENLRGEEGEIIKIEYKKYAKWFCLLMTYIISMWIVYIAWNLSYAFLYFDSLTNMFRMLFNLYRAITWPVIVVSLIVFVARYVNDLKVEKLINRGLTVK